MTLTLIISTYDQPLSLAKVLRGISQQSRWPDEIFLADDGSDHKTRALIERWKLDSRAAVHHLWHSHNGFRKIKLLNQAVAGASGEYLIFLDGDCVPHRKFIADHERLAESGFWVQGRRCYVEEQFVPEFEPGQTSIWRWLFARRIRGVAKSVRLPCPFVLRNKKQRGIIGCNMAFWRRDVLAVNGFDETYIGRGIGPDSDLGTRLYNLGRPRKFVYGHALVYHLNHQVAPRVDLPAKRARLEELLRTGKTRCELG